MVNTEQINLSENALKVLEKRYLLKDEHGQNIETIPELFWRVANSIAYADKLFDPNADTEATAAKFRELMINKKFLPNSPTLMNAGKEMGQLSACFVLPVKDSMEDIFDAIKYAALIHKSGGGTGFSFSQLRPSGSTVRTTGGVASGPVSFMKVFNMATEAVKQGGARRGANMGILRIDHPDILDFISCKKDNRDITNFNISVGITEDFMEAVEKGEQYNLYDPHNNHVVNSLDAKEVFEKIVAFAWQNGEPGIIFLDRLNRDNPVPSQGLIESTNPCGEQPLLPFESCNLGSINLSLFIKKDESGSKHIDFDDLAQTVHAAVHFLDNVIEVNKYPLPQIDDMTKLTRKIGLGVMGFADLLLHLGLPYNSTKAIELGGQIMEFIQKEGHLASQNLAKSRGSFPTFEASVFNQLEGMRNATITTIAPTGTLSIIANCSSGVEPIFAYVYIREIMDRTRMIEVNPILKELLIERNLYSDDLMRKISEAGSLAHIEEIPADIRRVFVCAHDISPIDHIEMQAAFQKYTDNAVSKTVNFSHDATKDDVREVYRLAWQLGCKGVTIYRDGSRDEQVLNIGIKEEAAKPQTSEHYDCIMPRPRPALVYGITERMQTGCGNLYVTVNYDEQGICEVFTSTGKVGGCPSQSEAVSRLVSITLRGGMCIEEILDQLSGIRCPSTMRNSDRNCASCPDAIGRVLAKVAKMLRENGGKVSSISQKTTQPLEASQRISKFAKHCPDCGNVLEHEGGCVSCRNCGYSKCN